MPCRPKIIAYSIVLPKISQHCEYLLKGQTVIFVKSDYLIHIKICTPLNFTPLILAPLLLAHPQILRPFNFCAPLFYCKFAVSFIHSSIFLLLSILLPLIFAQARCVKIIGIRYVNRNIYLDLMILTLFYCLKIYIENDRILIFCLYTKEHYVLSAHFMDFPMSELITRINRYFLYTQ